MKLQDRALLVRLRIESCGTSHKDKEANRALARQQQSQEAATDVIARLMPRDAFKDVKAAAETAREYVREQAQPWTDDGARLLDAGSLFDLQAELRTKYRPAWWSKVQEVVAKLPYYRDVWGPDNLGNLYKASLYPTAEKLEAKFKWNLDVMPLNPDSKELRRILGDEYVEQIQREVENRMAAQLYERLAEPLRAMVRQLSDPDGKVHSKLWHLESIANLIPSLNLTGDAKLASLQDELLSLGQTDADLIRENPVARAETARTASTLLATISEYLPEVSDSLSPSAGERAGERGQPEPEPFAQPTLGGVDFVANGFGHSNGHSNHVLHAPDVTEAEPADLVSATIIEHPPVALVATSPSPAKPAISWRDRLAARFAAR